VIRSERLRQSLDLMDRARRGIRRYGIAGSVKLAVSMGGGLIYRRERHVWYALDLAGEREPVEPRAEFSLIRAGLDDLVLLEQLPTVGLSTARQRLFSGADLWIVHENGRAAFSCWIFRNRTPALAARGGWLDIPPGVVCLEDSVTSPHYRGRGVAPGAWSGIANRLRVEGDSVMITKVEERNTPCRRGLEKAGFRPVASMSLLRLWPASRVAVLPHGDDDVAAFLVERLSR
jgi:GNAT superfamily N-acetyltransferase